MTWPLPTYSLNCVRLLPWWNNTLTLWLHTAAPGGGRTRSLTRFLLGVTRECQLSGGGRTRRHAVFAPDTFFAHHENTYTHWSHIAASVGGTTNTTCFNIPASGGGTAQSLLRDTF